MRASTIRIRLIGAGKSKVIHTRPINSKVNIWPASSAAVISKFILQVLSTSIASTVLTNCVAVLWEQLHWSDKRTAQLAFKYHDKIWKRTKWKSMWHPISFSTIGCCGWLCCWSLWAYQYSYIRHTMPTRHWNDIRRHNAFTCHQYWKQKRTERRWPVTIHSKAMRSTKRAALPAIANW